MPVPIAAAVGGGLLGLYALRRALGIADKRTEAKRGHERALKELEIQEKLSVAEQKARERGLVLKRQMLIDNMAEIRRRDAQDQAERAQQSMAQLGVNQQNVQLALLSQLAAGMGAMQGGGMSQQRAMLPMSLVR